MAITFFRSLSGAGFAATAIAFGPARMGFGLFVPEFRDAFSLSTSLVGIISSLGFAGFLLGLVIAQLLLLRRGPEAPVIVGLTFAVCGIALVALAPNVWILAVGVGLAASSAGFDWTPFNDAVDRKVSENWKGLALSGISSGTAVGIALAGAVGLLTVLTGLSWRFAWAGFAAAAALVLVANWAALRNVEKAQDAETSLKLGAVLNRRAVPLYIVAIVFGIVSANYISFTADHMQSQGSLPGLPERAIPAIIFLTYGIFGLGGLLTDSAERRLGLTWLLRLLMAAAVLSMALPILLPGTWTGLLASAGLQGLFIMMLSAILAFWCERTFPEWPSLGFTAVLTASAVGSVLGPLVGGWASDSFGPSALFFGTAAFPAAAMIWLRADHTRTAPDQARP